MLSVSSLASLGAPPELVDVWRESIEVLTDVQEKAVRAGALDGRTNLLVMAPTSSGKTLVGEMAATTSAYTRRRHAIFIVPFRALAEEHYDLFRARYAHLLSVVISTADWSEFDVDIRAGNFNLAVMTYEKLMSFLAQQPDLLGRCTALVVDEVQLLGDGERGARLELLLTQVLLAQDSPQVIALSASLDEVGGLEAWLKSRLVSSIERPVPLTQYVCDPSGTAQTPTSAATVSTRQMVDRQSDEDGLVLALAQRFVSEGKQVVIFRATIPKVAKTASQLRLRLPAPGLGQTLGERFALLDDSESVGSLKLCLAAGVGFHTADLTRPERSLVEDAFRNGEARVLVATTTIAMGVNLPCDAVIVADTTRPILGRTGWERQDISVAEYRNAAGRAGRLGQSSAGEAVLVARNAIERRQLVNAYLLGQVAPIESQIPKRGFEDIVFEVICARLADTEDAVVDFITATFAYQTFYEGHGGGLAKVRGAVADAVAVCDEHGLLVRDQKRLGPSAVARILGAAGLSLTSAAQFSSLLERSARVDPSRQDLIFEVASCEQVGYRPWPQRRWDAEIPPQPHQVPDGSDCGPASRLAQTLAKATASSQENKALLRAKCLIDWMNGTQERTILATFPNMGITSARIRDLGKNAAWLFDALADAAEVGEASTSLCEHIRALALEARYGLPAALAPLARLRTAGVSRAHLLRLQQAGLVDPSTILDAPDTAFEGLITPLQLDRLRRATETATQESLQRQRSGQVARAEQGDLPAALIDDLYTTSGQELEQAVTDALVHVGLSAARVVVQLRGEEDIQVTHRDGTVSISVTASGDGIKPITWTKAKEILGAGVGFNPVNYVCIGRPGFHLLAETNAAGIARETGSRSLLLIAIPVLAEALVRIVKAHRFCRSVLSSMACHRREHRGGSVWAVWFLWPGLCVVWLE